MKDIAKTSGAVSVLHTASTVVAANAPDREYIRVENNGSNLIFLQLAVTPKNVPDGQRTPTPPTAVLNEGIRLATVGTVGSVWESYSYTGPVAGLAATGTTVALVVDQ